MSESWKPNFEVPEKAECTLFGDLLSSYDKALLRLHELGIIISPTGRLTRYQKTLHDYFEREPPISTVYEANRFVFALREIQEIIEIVEALGENPAPEELSKVRRLPGGNWHPDEDQDSSARDYQYEFWLKYLLSRRGIFCELKEPDLLFRWGQTMYPIAAKRPKSHSSLDTRFRAALKQLDPFSVGGIAAISIDFLLRPPAKVLGVRSPLEAAQAMDILFVNTLQWLISQESPLTKRVTGRNAIAFLITGRLPAFIQGPGAFCMETRCEFLWVPDDERHRGLVGLRDVLSSYSGKTL
jgi:hypothetical protein